MKVTIAILATLLVTTGALAQNRSAYYGPFTDAEAQLLSAVWPEIREAEDFDDINWPAHGLARAPGNREVQRLLSANWDEVRHAARFEQIDWDELAEDRPQTRDYDDERSQDRYDEQFQSGSGARGAGPFTRAEASLMSEAWPQIRAAEAFGDINWRAIGLSKAPGDRNAHRIMVDNWSELRKARHFDDIDWGATVDYRQQYGYRTR
jgi:hypothetical protein